MNCLSCGKEIPESLLQSIQASSLYCPHCGARLDTGRKDLSGQPDTAPAAEIILRRTSQLTASLTKFEIYIDDKKAGTIGNNEKERFEVRPGRHTFYIKIDDLKSKTLNISLKPGDSLRLVCWAKAFGLGVMIGFE